MRKVSGLLRVQVCAVLGAAVFVGLVGGCPGIDLSALLGATVAPAVTATAGGEATVDKTVNLTAAITGGTAPYTVAWGLASGPSATITNGNSANASFVPQQAGIYVFAVSVTDASGLAATAQVEVVVGDLEFWIPNGGGILISGNPALVRTSSRSSFLELEPRARVYDPLYVDDQKTDMTITYDIVSVPTGARLQDAAFDHTFQTISNQGMGDFSNTTGPNNSLDAVVFFTIRPNPTSKFTALTNVATTVDNFGTIVPGAYVVRATVTNAAGVMRSRDLPIQVDVEGVTGPYGSTADSGPAISSGPTTVRVKQLPAAGTGRVTDKVLTPAQTATMVVTVFPSTQTTYRFYLIDNVAGTGVARPDLVAASASTVDPTGAPQDVTLTIGAAGMPTGTYTLSCETFDNYGQLANFAITVNAAATPVRFHVTQDYFAATSLNAALVGQTSNDPDTPTAYKGWMGSTLANYGTREVLADVNLDGVLDVLSLSGTTVYANTGGFVKGSDAALRHPVNPGNFGQVLGGVGTLFALTGATNATQIAVGDLNGDGLPDVAVAVDTALATAQVRVYFHTGDLNQPYSTATDQALLILPPATDRQNLLLGTQTLSAGLAVDKTQFGTQIGIFDQNGDSKPDLVITDPGFSKALVTHVADPGVGNIAPPAANSFYLGGQGRVYTFAGGATGQLKPGRAQIVTSLITERQINDASAGVFPANPVLSTSFAEVGVNYTQVYEGNPLDQIGLALSNPGAGFAVGSAAAAGTGVKYGVIQILSPVADGEEVRLAVTLPGSTTVNRSYEFDTNSPAAVGTTYAPTVNARVDLSSGDVSPSRAIGQLIAAINADVATQKLVTAALDPVRPERIILTYAANAAATLDGAPRTITASETMAAANNIAVIGVFVQNMDGRVYRVASNLASGVLAPATGVTGITNSNMGLGALVALGKFNGTATADDLAIAALDPGTAAGVNSGLPFDLGDDGAVFVLLDGSVTLGAPVSGVGATTLRSNSFATGGADIAPTAVGASLAFGDVDGDGFDELFFTEPGFDHVCLIKGKAPPATTPDITFAGVNFSGTPAPVGASLTFPGTFLFGDLTADARVDWVFIDGANNFGFLGIDR